jgi:hypothetical protein
MAWRAGIRAISSPERGGGALVLWVYPILAAAVAHFVFGVGWRHLVPALLALYSLYVLFMLIMLAIVRHRERLDLRAQVARLLRERGP